MLQTPRRHLIQNDTQDEISYEIFREGRSCRDRVDDETRARARVLAGEESCSLCTWTRSYTRNIGFTENGVLHYRQNYCPRCTRRIARLARQNLHRFRRPSSAEAPHFAESSVSSNRSGGVVGGGRVLRTLESCFCLCRLLRRRKQPRRAVISVLLL